jgi:phosphoenolpyruvate synthase/pyruvate phosphate dikinase
MSAPALSELNEDERSALTDLVIRGMLRGPVPTVLERLAAAGLVREQGAYLVPAEEGVSIARGLLRLPAGSTVDLEVQALYRSFLPVNLRLREVCTAWQCRGDGELNDHTDPAYDEGVRVRLAGIHAAVVPLLRRFAGLVPRLGRYEPGLASALARVASGDGDWVTAPLADSYHTVWMRLHQELLLTLGISRAEDRELEGAVDGQEPVAAASVSPGAAAGRLSLPGRDVAEGDPAVLVVTDAASLDLAGLHTAAAVVIARGGLASHAAVVARGLGKPAVCAPPGTRLDPDAGLVLPGGRCLGAGEWVTVDGTAGRIVGGVVETEVQAAPSIGADVLEQADRKRRLRVYANADTADQAEAAFRGGADGIGLCRTEHHFLGERTKLIGGLVAAESADETGRALCSIAEVEEHAFRDLLRAVGDRPLTVRLLDAPLHEFMPSRETNPMLGTRGVRLALLRPGLYPAQARALLRAWAGQRAEGGEGPRLRILIPFVSVPAELSAAVAAVRAAADGVAAEASVKVPYEIGCMVETPRAALLAGELAGLADFLSFGTNDLTQLTYGFSRDDMEGELLTPYRDRALLPANPFETLDADGVGALLEIAVGRARAASPTTALGLCGEHGGDPASIALCERLGLDYVSCPPGRVPAARVAAARAVDIGGSAPWISD